MIYNSYKYIYPCRPKNPIPPTELNDWEKMGMFGQPKLNGSNCTIFTNRKELHIMNRHNERLTNFKIDKDEIFSILDSDNWVAINGEYLNKNQLDENKKEFNHKLVLFDILVLDSTYLLGKTFRERINIIYDKFGTKESEKDYLYKISDNIFSVKTYEKDFLNLYNEFTKVDLLEGLVLKRSNAKLEPGLREDNNSKSQVKSRKQTKNYKF